MKRCYQNLLIGLVLVFALPSHAAKMMDLCGNAQATPTITAFRNANFALHVGGFIDPNGFPTNLNQPRYEYLKPTDFKSTLWLQRQTGETWTAIPGTNYTDLSPANRASIIRAEKKWCAQIQPGQTNPRLHVDCIMECPKGREDDSAALVEEISAAGFKVMANDGDPYTAGITDIRTPWGRINKVSDVVFIQVGVDFGQFFLSRFVYTIMVANYYVAQNKSVIVGVMDVGGVNYKLAQQFFSSAIFDNPLVYAHYYTSYTEDVNAGLQIPGGKAVTEPIPTELPGLGLLSPLTPLGGTLYVPSDNWWNLKVDQAPLDPRNTEILASIASYETTKGRIHPDFGGIYGIPYCVVGNETPLVPVSISNTAESDKGYPGGASGYPIPAAANLPSGSNPYLENGGGNDGDSHLLIYDRDKKAAFELSYANYSSGRWSAGYGAVFKLDSNYRRPEGYTSTDAAGLCVLAGLVQYDEVYGPGEIKHATRVSVKQVGLKYAAKGYVWPASHQASMDAGGLPLGTRFRLKASFNTSGYPAPLKKLFDSWKVYGLIVADRGGNGYIQGTRDSRWSNDVLNPAFHSLVLSRDFEVIQLGWKPTS